MERLFLIAALAAYVVATWLFGALVLRANDAHARRGVIALATGFVFQTLSILSHFSQAGLLPVTTFGEGLSFFAWLIVGTFLVLGRSERVSAVGVVISPLATVMTAGASVFFVQSVPIPAELHSVWLPVHVTLAFLGNAVFGIAFAVSVIYLFEERRLKLRRDAWLLSRLPSLEQLDRLNYRCLVWGFPLLSLGILTGGIWAANTWGRFWSGELREILSLATWLVYAGLLQFRLTAGLRGRRAATLTIVGFALVVVSYVSVSLLNLPGRHGGTLGS